ncbi:hypothetical protein DAI22_09g078200 [Oryza sativa Japonica Group]|nr:hypothetical protein DAI22_09g078200 [Oryza sativa Japonica Group]
MTRRAGPTRRAAAAGSDQAWDGTAILGTSKRYCAYARKARLATDGRGSPRVGGERRGGKPAAGSAWSTALPPHALPLLVLRLQHVARRVRPGQRRIGDGGAAGSNDELREGGGELLVLRRRRGSHSVPSYSGSGDENGGGGDENAASFHGRFLSRPVRARRVRGRRWRGRRVPSRRRRHPSVGTGRCHPREREG